MMHLLRDPGLANKNEGWVLLDTITSAKKIKFFKVKDEDILTVIEHDPKKRFEFKSEK